MFDTLFGLPAHALIVHAAVVFVPLQAFSALVYVFLPSLRPKMEWAAAALLVVGPGAAFAAKQSGENYREKLIGDGLSTAGIARVDEHMNFGGMTWYFSLGLAFVTLVVMLLARQAKAKPEAKGVLSSVAVDWALRILILGLAGVTLYYVARTGDTGARMKWGV